MNKNKSVPTKVFVIDGSRPPFLKARGKAGRFKASDLAVTAGRPLLTRQPFENDSNGAAFVRRIDHLPLPVIK